MKYTFYSRKFGHEITFSRPGTGYVYVDMSGSNPGTLGRQICSGGGFLGSTLSYYGDSDDGFENFCRRWWKKYLHSY